MAMRCVMVDQGHRIGDCLVEMPAGRYPAIKSGRTTGLSGLNVQAVIPAKPVLSRVEGAGIQILKLDSASRAALPVAGAVEGNAAECVHNNNLGDRI